MRLRQQMLKQKGKTEVISLQGQQLRTQGPIVGLLESGRLRQMFLIHVRF